MDDNDILQSLPTGIQCHNRVLLVAISGGVQFRSAYRRRSEEEDSEGGLNHEAREILDRGRHPCLQQLRLVDDRTQDQVTVMN